MQLYLVFASSFFSAGLSGAGAASFEGSLAAAGGAGSAGAAGAGGGGGGGAGSSFLPHPTNVTVNAKRITADNETNFFPILDSPPFPSHISKPLSVSKLYRTCELDIQAGIGPRRPYSCGKIGLPKLSLNLARKGKRPCASARAAANPIPR